MDVHLPLRRSGPCATSTKPLPTPLLQSVWLLVKTNESSSASSWSQSNVNAGVLWLSISRSLVWHRVLLCL